MPVLWKFGLTVGSKALWPGLSFGNSLAEIARQSRSRPAYWERGMPVLSL